MLNWIKQLCGPSKGPGGNKPQTRFLIGSWAFFAFIGLIMPETILRDYDWTQGFTDAVASVVPQIDRITALNLRPDINRFHYSLLWVVSPVYFVIAMISGNQNVALGYNRITKGQVIGTLLFYVYGIGFTMYLWMGFWFMYPESRVVQIFIYYRLSRAAVAPILVYGFWGCVGGITLTIKGLISGQILKEQGEIAHGRE